MSRLSQLPIGARIIAVRDLGPIPERAPGIITGTTVKPFLFFWQRFYYLCTFADNVKVAARPQDVESFDHGRTLQQLEIPNYAELILSRPHQRH
jgi:hypothetical protein